MPEFPSDAWFQDFIVRINGSSVYRTAAKDWEGDIAFLIEAEPDKHMPTDVWGYLDLWHGSCRGGGVVSAAEGETAAFVIRGPYSRWKDVLRGDLDPIRGMVQGKLQVRGDLPTIIRYVNAANELVHLTGTVDTVFPDA
ncbi:MAG: SCP2 sterol-binding domain-containing protein [Actinomycetota bacterium]